MMLRVIALASALTLTEAAPSTRQKLVAIVLPNSTAGSVRVLHVDSKPVARSYDGLDWERTQGGATLGIDCGGGACQAKISTGSAFTITSHKVPIENTLTPLHKASRFLTQATFGPTRATLQSVDATTGAGVTKWIHDQMALPPTLHREYFRRRANPRLFMARPIGSIRSACTAGSRWHRFAFSRNDEGKTLQVVAKEGSGAALYIDGELRTEVAEKPSANISMSTICAVEERVGGSIATGDCTDRAEARQGYPGAVVLENPQIAFSMANPGVTHTLADSEGPLAPLPGVRDASLLQGDLACGAWMNNATGLFLLDEENAYWRHDPRLQLLSNTLEQPYNGSVSNAHLLPAPNVAKTFLNEHTCVPLKQQGSVASYTSATFQLNQTMIRNFYDLGSRLVYYVDGK